MDRKGSMGRNISKNSGLAKVNRESVLRMTRKKVTECFLRKLRGLEPVKEAGLLSSSGGCAKVLWKMANIFQKWNLLGSSKLVREREVYLESALYI